MSKKVVTEGQSVEVHYTGKLQDGTVFDSTEGEAPFVCTVGSQDLIKGFNQALLGMKEGDSKKVLIAPEDGFGIYHDDLIVKLPTSQLPPECSEGDLLEDEQTGVQWMVKEVGDNMVTLDGNHFLAGKSLEFSLQLVRIIT